MSSVLAAGTQPEAKKISGTHVRRLDIEGLRAFAVIAVVLDHLLHWPGGGFVGVDIFFVISGYLISGILLREVRTNGRVDFLNFYIRRVKRIMPAAVLVLSVTVTAAYIIFYSGRAASIAGDAFWALLFSANWRFAILGTDYMNSGSSVSPIQHYWSLGVEEQFYIVWPWVILAGVILAQRLKFNARGTLAMLSSAIILPILLSFVFALWETQSSHTVAYFSTISRAWELGAGALLAVLTATHAGFRKWTRLALLWLGLAILIGSLLFITPETPFPAPYAFFPVIGACLIILAGSGPVGADDYRKHAWILTNRLSREVGRISYSLYLWHFPVIVLLTAFLPQGSIRFSVIATVLMVILSMLSFRFVEDPIRRSNLWTKRDATIEGTSSSEKDRRKTTIWLAAFVALVVVAPLIAFVSLGQKSESSAVNPTGPASDGIATVAGRQAALGAALRATDWPALSPNPAEMGPDGALAKPVEWIQDGCLGGALSPLAHSKDVIENAKSCVYGKPDAPSSMIIFGDSTTMSFVPGIRKSLEGKDWTIYVYTVAACSPTLVPVDQDASAQECVRFKEWVVNEIQRLRPTTVVSSFLRNDDHLKSKATGGEADAEWMTNIANMARFVIGQGSRYVLLEAPAPAKAEPSQCITRFSRPADCVTDRANAFDVQRDVESQALSGLGPNATFVPTVDWFCVEGRCPAFIGNTALYADKNHISARASEELAPLIGRVFATAP